MYEFIVNKCLLYMREIKNDAFDRYIFLSSKKQLLYVR